jgi:isoleucyl-tRNA synthetase
LGKRLGKEIGKVTKAVKEMSQEDLLCFQKSESVVLGGYTLSSDDISIKHEFCVPDGYAKSDIDAASGEDGVMVVLELTVDQKLLDSGAARELVNRVQKLRKSVGLQSSDEILVFFEGQADADSHPREAMMRMFQNEAKYLNAALGCELRHASVKPPHAVTLASDTCALSNRATFTVSLTRRCILLNERALYSACNSCDDLAAAVSAVVVSQDYSSLRAEAQAKNGTIIVVVDGKTVTIQDGKEFMLP